MDPASYEGLVFSTAARYAPILDDDLEDIQQILRVKVWKSLNAFDSARTKLGVESWVFSCLKNQVKDLLKSQTRRNAARQGRQLYTEEVASDLTAKFEARYLSLSADEIYGCVEDEEVTLPATLTDSERAYVYLLLMDFSPAEIAVTLAVTRNRVRHLRESVQLKMADWRPSTAETPAVAVAA